MGKRKKRKGNNWLPVHIIKAAASGDVLAINEVLKCYESYIIALSTKRLYDDDRNPHFIVDNETRRSLETNLIVKIMKFDIAKIA